ncbi:MAG: biotin synthase BioB [Azospirillum brasilense]|nr:MAG: biotin synthase BioB [Azospirillum brasilense]
MNSNPRHDWTREQALALFAKPLNDLLFEAASIHRQHFDPNEVQVSTLCSIKTGGCAEDCGYCSQSAKFDTEVKATKRMEVEEVLKNAADAKARGATRFCMGAAWRSPKSRDMEPLKEMIAGVKAMGMETCATLGMLSPEQALELAHAGLDYYNHNLDTSENFYGEIITTRTYQDRLDTLANVRDAGMKTCCGGIMGMGEQETDRADLLVTLANLPSHPESVPMNMLIAIKGTQLEATPRLDPIEFVRTIAVARIMLPKSFVRLSAGREHMTKETQAMCFFAGANSIFYGEKLLTAANPGEDSDDALFAELGLRPMVLAPEETAKAA